MRGLRIRPFYCDECKRYLNRNGVVWDMWDNRFYCKACDNATFKTHKVLEDLMNEYRLDLKRLGKNEDDYK